MAMSESRIRPLFGNLLGRRLRITKILSADRGVPRIAEFVTY